MEEDIFKNIWFSNATVLIKELIQSIFFTFSLYREVLKFLSIQTVSVMVVNACVKHP